MELGLRKYKEIYIVDVKSDMDLYNSNELKVLVNNLMKRNVEKLIINLEEVEYIDSSGVGILIYIFTELKKKNCQLRFARVHGSVAKVIKLTKLLDYFPIVDNINIAINQLDQTAGGENGNK